MDTTTSSIARALVEIGAVDRVDRVGPATRLIDEIGLDSMSVIELLAALERHVKGFSIDVNDLAADHFASIGALAQYVDGKVASTNE